MVANVFSVDSLIDALAQACQTFNSSYIKSSGILSQIWLPKENQNGSEIVLHTQNLPYAISSRHDLLALFRCVSVRYKFSTDVHQKEKLGCVGRVFTQKHPEMCASVQVYQPRVYLRVEEAQKCNVNSTVVVPVFTVREGGKDRKAVAVFEVVHVDAQQSFLECLRTMQFALESQNLFTVDLNSIVLQPGLGELDFQWSASKVGGNLRVMSRLEPRTAQQTTEGNHYLISEPSSKKDDDCGDGGGGALEGSSSSCSQNDAVIETNNISSMPNSNDDKDNQKDALILNKKTLQLGQQIVTFEEDIAEPILTDEDEDSDDAEFADEVDDEQAAGRPEDDVVSLIRSKLAKIQNNGHLYSPALPQSLFSTHVQNMQHAQHLQHAQNVQHVSHPHHMLHVQNVTQPHVLQSNQVVSNTPQQLFAGQLGLYPSQFYPSQNPPSLQVAGLTPPGSHSFLQQLQSSEIPLQSTPQTNAINSMIPMQYVQQDKSFGGQVVQRGGGKEQDKEGANVNNPKQVGYGHRLTYDDLVKHFGMGLKDAAGALGVCTTTLKRACRRYGIKKWPRRQLQRLSKALNSMHGVGLEDPLKFLNEKSEAQEIIAQEIARSTRKKPAKPSATRTKTGSSIKDLEASQKLQSQLGQKDGGMLSQFQMVNQFPDKMIEGDWHKLVGLDQSGGNTQNVSSNNNNNFWAFMEHPQELSSLLKDIEGAGFEELDMEGISSLRNS
eukprot:TRINITY_DN3758_c0_g1_i1.p1 TRINITY_DN3758_c0_g1~~TRINITY_DN3758_c0_g1_i1.p1  ORF type:complete len:720 (-),score=126.29 TRINITY_DN3758_c0_g1_i1:2945-5104(-)